MDTGTKGAYNELVATAWLLNNGYQVFRNVSACGPVDLVAMKNSETILIDVKQGQIYKGRKLSVALKISQIALGIKTLLVYPDDVCVLDLNPQPTQRHVPELRECVHCLKEFQTKTPQSRFCTIKCGNVYSQTKYKAKMALQRATNGL